MSKTLVFKHRRVARLAAFAAAGAIVVYTIAAAADGRALHGSFCSHPVSGSPFPPGLCMQLTFNDQTVQGFFGSPGQISLRPGNYWLTVTDDSNKHNFSFSGPDGLDQDFTTIDEGSPTNPVVRTFKLHLKHGSYTLFCDAPGHAAAGMQIGIDVRGEGQEDNDR